MAAVGDGGGEDEMMQCTQHPFKNTSPGGGICAFCLQDKLGKLVSSSSSSSSTYNSPSFLPLPSSSPPSFRSDNNNNNNNTTTSSTTSSSSQYLHRGFGGFVGGTGSGGGGGGVRPRLPFLLTPKKKNQNPSVSSFNRSKSTTNVATRFHTTDFAVNTPRRRGFWSFLHLSHKKPPQQPPPQQPPQPQRLHPQVVILEEEEEDTDSSRNSNENTTNTVERKVSRSRSVGCGSRSFSGDLFERISSGFGDCTLRRVESHREGSNHRHSTSAVMRDKVRCGGLFGGFMMIASSSSSTTSSSSSYLVSSANNNNNNNNNQNNNSNAANVKPKAWGWAFSSPRRAFIKPNNNNVSNAGNINSNGNNDNNNKAPNLNSIPSLLSVRS